MPRDDLGLLAEHLEVDFGAAVEEAADLAAQLVAVLLVQRGEVLFPGRRAGRQPGRDGLDCSATPIAGLAREALIVSRVGDVAVRPQRSSSVQSSAQIWRQISA